MAPRGGRKSKTTQAAPSPAASIADKKVLFERTAKRVKLTDADDGFTSPTGFQSPTPVLSPRSPRSTAASTTADDESVTCAPVAAGSKCEIIYDSSDESKCAATSAPSTPGQPSAPTAVNKLQDVIKNIDSRSLQDTIAKDVDAKLTEENVETFNSAMNK